MIYFCQNGIIILYIFAIFIRASLQGGPNKRGYPSHNITSQLFNINYKTLLMDLML